MKAKIKTHNAQYKRAHYRIAQSNILLEYALEGLFLAANAFEGNGNREKVNDVQQQIFKLLKETTWDLENTYLSKCSDEYKKYITDNLKEHNIIPKKDIDTYMRDGAFLRTRFSNDELAQFKLKLLARQKVLKNEKK